jgi:hypothetical protein
MKYNSLFMWTEIHCQTTFKYVFSFLIYCFCNIHHYCCMYLNLATMSEISSTKFNTVKLDGFGNFGL